MNRLCYLNSMLLVLTVAGLVRAQEADSKKVKTIDPSGTWVWEQEFGGNTISRELRLSLQNNKLSGTYKSIFENTDNLPPGIEEPVEIANAKLDGDEISFDVIRMFNDNEMKITFSTVISGDELAGVTEMDFGGQTREFEWTAKRVVSTSNDAAADEPVATPGRIPAPAPQVDGPYPPQPILPGGIVVALYAPDSPALNSDRVGEPEKYNMTNGVPGRIQSIVNIHNPSIEVHTVSPSMNTGAVVIVAAGGGHRTLNVGTESADFVPYFYNYGINTVILRNRLRSDGYSPQTDAVSDAMQAIRLVRKFSDQWHFDPNKIGIMGFSAGAELSAPAAVMFKKFDEEHSDASDPLAGTSSRPDFVGIIYPGPTPFTRDPDMEVPRDAPPAFITCAGAGDRIHAIWADDYFRAMLAEGIPNVEMHIYGNGYHPGTRGATGGLTHRDGIPFGTWPERFVDWFRDLGYLGKPGVETKAAIDSKEFVSRPPRGRGGFGRGGAGRRGPQRGEAGTGEAATRQRPRRPQSESTENESP